MFTACAQKNKVSQEERKGDYMEPKEFETQENTSTEETSPILTDGATTTAAPQATTDMAMAHATAIARAGGSNPTAVQNGAGNDSAEDNTGDKLSETITNAVLEALRRRDQEIQIQNDDVPCQNQIDPGTGRKNNLIWLVKQTAGVIFIREDKVIGDRIVRLDTTTVEVKRALLAVMLFGAQGILLFFGAILVFTSLFGPYIENLKTLYDTIEYPAFSFFVGLVIAYISRIVRIMRIETMVMDEGQISNNLMLAVAFITALAALWALLG